MYCYIYIHIILYIVCVYIYILYHNIAYTNSDQPQLTKLTIPGSLEPLGPLGPEADWPTGPRSLRRFRS